MTRYVVIFIGVAVISFALMYACARMLSISVNDAEYRNVYRTGMTSHPEKMSWSSWSPVDHNSIRVFSGVLEDGHIPQITEWRKGTWRGIIFSFTTYEGRVTPSAKIYAATGPEWGYGYQPLSLATLAIVFAGVISLLRLFLGELWRQRAMLFQYTT